MKINRGKLALAEHDRLLEQRKEDFDKIVEETQMVKDGKVQIKMKVLTLPTPVYGDRQGQLVMGRGGKGKEMVGRDGSAGGDDHSDVRYEMVDFDEFIKEYQKMLLRDLELPLQKKKHKGDAPKEEFELDDFAREGLRCDLDLDRTIEQSYERAFRERKKEVMPDPRIDGWYWDEKPTKQCLNKSLEVYILDVSGSVNGTILSLIRKMIFCLYYYLDKKYTKNERRYIIFQDTAEEKSRDDFFSASTRGGTHISSGLEKALLLAKGYDDYDKYLFFFSDFDNANSDDEKAGDVFDQLTKEFTYLCMAHISAGEKSEPYFSQKAKKSAKQFSHVAYTHLDAEEKIKEAIIHLLTKYEKSEKI